MSEEKEDLTSGDLSQHQPQMKRMKKNQQEQEQLVEASALVRPLLECYLIFNNNKIAVTFLIFSTL